MKMIVHYVVLNKKGDFEISFPQTAKDLTGDLFVAFIAHFLRGLVWVS